MTVSISVVVLGSSASLSVSCYITRADLLSTCGMLNDAESEAELIRASMYWQL